MKVCVIGAGASGLVAIKELGELGHTVECFEKRHSIGGVYVDVSDTAVYDSTHLTNSNYFVAFSSFPPKDGEKRRHWHCTEYVDYLEAFCNEFKLRESIQFDTAVQRVARDGDGFSVEIVKGGVATTEFYDAIAVCSGNVSMANVPVFKGADSFIGQIVHTEAYRNAAEFAGKRVVCVGLGETGADVLHEVAELASNCVLSIRHYPFVVSRFPDGGNPTDARSGRGLHLHRRCLQDVGMFEENLADLDSAEEDKRLQAEWLLKCVSPRSQFATKSSVFMPDVAQGRVHVNASGISHLTADSVVFNDGFRVQADVVICSTGYRYDVSFLADVHIADVRRQLYKHTICPELGPRLAFIGLFRSDMGGIPVIAEMQSRYFAMLCSGQRRLPDSEALSKAIQADAQAEEEWFCITPIQSLLHYSLFIDDLADVVGCQPKISTLIKSPVLLYNYWFGSQLSYQYRLDGPGKNRNAMEKVIRKLGVVFWYVELRAILRWHAISLVFDMLGVNREYSDNTSLMSKPFMKTRFWTMLLVQLCVLGGIFVVSLSAHTCGLSLWWIAAILLALAFYTFHDIIDAAIRERNYLVRAKREGKRLQAIRIRK